MIRSLVVAAAASLSCSAPNRTPTAPKPAPPPTTNPVAVPPTATSAASALPVRLPRSFLPTGYTARLAIDPKQPAFSGSIQIAGALSERSSTLLLHGHQLAIRSASARRDATEVPLTATLKGIDVIELRAATPLDPGAWTVAIEYAGQLDAVNTAGAFRQKVGEHWYVHTQLEAVYARRVFPCFDEPDNKVPWKLTLDVPAALVAVANTPQVSETPLSADHKRVEFALTKPLPTYLVAFGVGPFDIVDAGKSKRGTPVRIVTLAKRAGDAALAAKATPKLLDATEDWFGTPYPYEKLDVLTIPLTVGFGAMENAGLVTFSEQLMLLDPAKASQQAKRRYIVIAAHEVAHQWFGNLVTPAFWDDIWLNEGFANWLEHKIVMKTDPAFREDRTMIDTRNTALAADALATARQVRQPIAAADDIFNAFDRITYDKGASVLAMFESYLGPELFQRGVRDYLTARAWGNATSADFVTQIAKTAAAQPATNRPLIDVEAAFATFLDQPGAPQITATLSCKSGKAEVALSQQRYLPPGAAAPKTGTPWIVPVCIAFESGGQRAEQCSVLSTKTATVALATRGCPRWIMPNVDGRGYYRNAYTTQQLVALRDEAWPALSDSEKLAVFFDVSTGATTNEVPLQLALSFVPKLLAQGDRFAVQPVVELITELFSLVPTELMPKYEHYVRTTLGPLATKVGFLPKEGESIDDESIRDETVTRVALLGREPKLVDEAVRLAQHWRELPQAIRGGVVRIAADMRPELFARLLKELATEPDRARRREIVFAIGGVRDVARQKQALALLLDSKRDIRELLPLLEGPFGEPNREAARELVRTNLDALLARSPSSETAAPVARVARLFTSTCRADQRDAVADYVMKSFGGLPGGQRVVRNAIEDMDQCIAKRRLIEPEVRAWLAGLRLPKPDAPKPAPKPAPNKKS